VSLPAFVAHFADLPDPRIERTKRHLLLDILVIAFCAVLCGAEGWEEIERFGRAKREWFQHRLGLSLANGIPSDDTFRRVFARLDTQAFSACFRAWVATLRALTDGEVIALDGKTLRHSFDSACGQKPLHLVSAFACENQLVLGSVPVADKSNEITAAPALLALPDLRGGIVTADALHCQKALAAQIKAQGGEYVLALKDNHPHLQEDVAACFAYQQAQRLPERVLDTHEQIDYGHGRQERRRCVCLPLDPTDRDWQDAQQQWAGLRCLVAIERERQIGAKVSRETHYFLASLPLCARQMARVLRQHWHIENRLHYILDVVFDEDACRIRADNAPANFALLRHTALNLLRQEKSPMSLKAKQKQAGWDNDFLLRVLLT